MLYRKNRFENYKIQLSFLCRRYKKSFQINFSKGYSFSKKMITSDFQTSRIKFSFRVEKIFLNCWYISKLDES